MYDDTIAAISTPLGEGGIGIIRLSGPESLTILNKVFVRSGRQADSRFFESRRLYYGHMVDRETGGTIDEVLAVFMAAPKTYTREDTVELNCHGGPVPLENALRLVLREGARLAEPGEFTLRAFVNGRIDLSQAEAVLDVVRAKTSRGLQAALQQLSGGLSSKLASIRSSVLTQLAQIQAMVEFPEDEIPAAEMAGPLADALDHLKALLATADAGMVYRHGVKTAIVGRPNVGKSSLLNALLHVDRAIVTDIPGTTRDSLEEVVSLQGVPICLVDTAGIASTNDPVERLGVERSRQILASADLVLIVLDASAPLSDDDKGILLSVEENWPGMAEGEGPGDAAARIILVLNKADLPGFVAEKEAHQLLPGAKVVHLSALTGIGLQDLEKTILEVVLVNQPTSSEALLVTNVRHKEALRRAVESLAAALTGFESGLPLDLTAIDLQVALEALGEITGETVTDDLLERIFRDFCIGK